MSRVDGFIQLIYELYRTLDYDLTPDNVGYIINIMHVIRQSYSDRDILCDPRIRPALNAFRAKAQKLPISPLAYQLINDLRHVFSNYTRTLRGRKNKGRKVPEGTRRRGRISKKYVQSNPWEDPIRKDSCYILTNAFMDNLLMEDTPWLDMPPFQALDFEEEIYLKNRTDVGMQYLNDCSRWSGIFVGVEYSAAMCNLLLKRANVKDLVGMTHKQFVKANKAMMEEVRKWCVYGESEGLEYFLEE